MAKIHELHVDFVCTIGGNESLLSSQLSVISEEEIETSTPFQITSAAGPSPMTSKHCQRNYSALIPLT
jgi:hypothetical protein